MRGAVLGLVLMLGSAAPAAAQAWWQGAWAIDPAWCKNANRIGTAQPAPIGITAQRVERFGHSCQIQRVRALPEVGAVSLTSRCRGDGGIYIEGRLIMPVGPNAVWMWTGEGPPVRYSRCPLRNTQDWLQRGN